MAERFPKVAGRCPMGCGETLFLGAGGHVTCLYIPCPEPGRAADMLDRLPAFKTMADHALELVLDEVERDRADAERWRAGQPDPETAEIKAWRS